jgi:molybdopterin/thiamine biosynthesis adenylyltransferase
MLPQVGGKGQKALAAARVLAIGAGGLGSAALPILVASGVGHVTLMDGDVVEASNLARQTLYRVADIGQLKVDVATRFLHALNPDATITALACNADAANLPALMAAHDLILDGSDNHATKFLVNRLAVQAGKPLVTASVMGMEGYVIGVNAHSSACLRCVFEDGTGEEAFTCHDAGVLSAAVAVVGAQQASLALTHLLNLADVMGTLWRYNTLQGGFRRYTIIKNQKCFDCALPHS